MQDKYGECAANFSDEENATIEDMAVKIASYKCFMENFMDACYMHIKNDYVAPIIQGLYPTK